MKLINALLFTTFSVSAFAHGPTPQKTDQMVVVKAPADVVWKLVSEPCAIKNWHSEVTDCKSSTPLKRTLTLKSGGKITEEIDELAAEDMSISYRLASDVDIKALPVSSLSGRIKLKKEGDTTQVSWSARYYRADTTNEPPKGLNDEAALNAVNSYIGAGLAGLSAPKASHKKAAEDK